MDGSGKADEEPKGPSTFDWLNMISAVHEETGYNFGQVYELPAIEFLTYLAYINNKREREQAEILRLKNQTRII